MDEKQLIHLSHLDTMLAQATRIDDITEVRALIEALRIYAVNIGESKETTNQIAMSRIKSERKAGQVLSSLPKQNGARPSDTGFTGLTPYGVTKSQSHRWQTIAKLPDDLFENMMLERFQSNDDITTSFFYKAAKIHDMRQRGISTDKPYKQTTPEDLTKIFRYAFFKGVYWRAWDPPVDIEDAIEAAMNEWENET